jgi:chemotaxis protein MotB
MALVRRGGGHGEVEENVFWTTMSDLLLGLMVVFMTLFILAMTGFTTEKIEQKKAEATLAEEVNQKLQADGIKQILTEADSTKVKEEIAGLSKEELGKLLAASNIDINKMLEGAGLKEKAANLSDKEVKEILDKLGEKELAALLKGLSSEEKKELAEDIAKKDKSFEKRLENIEKLGVDIALKSANKGSVAEEIVGLSKEDLGKLIAAAMGKGQGEEKNIANLSDKEIKEIIDKMGAEEFAKLLKGLTGDEKKDIAKNLGDKDKQFKATLEKMDKLANETALKSMSPAELKEKIASMSKEDKKALAAIAKGEVDKNYLGNLSQTEIKEVINKLGKDDYARLLANLSVNTQDKIAKKMGEDDEDISKKLKKLESENLSVDGLNGLVKISDLELFELNSYVLSAKGKKVLDKFFPVYIDTLFSHPEIVEKMSGFVIQGHTDSQSFKGVSTPEMQFQRNMELSLKRANAVAEYMFKTKYNKKYTPLLIKYVQVEGKSFTEPILVNGKEDYAKSRRVELKINSKQANFDTFMQGVNK